MFDELEGIILQCPTLLAEVNIIRYHKIIEHQTLGIKYQAMSSDSHRLQGLLLTMRPNNLVRKISGNCGDRDNYGFLID